MLRRLIIVACVVASSVAPALVIPAPAGAAVSRASAERVFRSAVEDVEGFWTDHYKDVGIKKFFPLPTAPTAYDKSSGQPGCGTSTRGPWQYNAFYCGRDDFVAYDVEVMIPQLQRDFGDLGDAVVAAHEYGHRLQQLLGVLDRGLPTIVTELQADCYAGVWTKARGKNYMRGSTLSDALASLISLRDGVAGAASEPGAHGSGFDRASAFQTGYEEGAAKCASFVRHPPETVLVPFSDSTEAANNGNLPTRELIDLASRDLDNFWHAKVKGFERIEITEPYVLDGTLPTCPGTKRTRKDYRNTVFYCAARNSVAWDQGHINDLADRLGDLAPGVLLANAWASAVQHHLGLATTGTAAALQADCLTGAWLGTIVHSERDSLVTLSPGDLDEGIQALLTSKSSGFDGVRSLRKGFAGNVKACGLS